MIVPGRGGMDGATALVDKAIELAGPTTVNAQRTLIITFTHSASITGLCERFKGGKGVLEGHEDGVVDGGEEVARLEACPALQPPIFRQAILTILWPIYTFVIALDLV